MPPFNLNSSVIYIKASTTVFFCFVCFLFVLLFNLGLELQTVFLICAIQGYYHLAIINILVSILNFMCICVCVSVYECGV